MTNKTIQAIKRHVAKIDTNNELSIDYIMMENESTLVALCTNHRLKSMGEESIYFNKIDGKWTSGCRSFGFASTYKEKILHENIGWICVYNRYDEQ